MFIRVNKELFDNLEGVVGLLDGLLTDLKEMGDAEIADHELRILESQFKKTIQLIRQNRPFNVA